MAGAVMVAVLEVIGVETQMAVVVVAEVVGEVVVRKEMVLGAGVALMTWVVGAVVEVEVAVRKVKVLHW